MLEVQKLFNESRSIHATDDPNATFLKALDSIGVCARDYPEHKMWVLDYSQIDSIKNHPVVDECRGLLMDYEGNIIRKGFTRFYNLGENGVDTFDFQNSVTFEKADGSLMFVYFCPPTNKWEIGTRGTAFAEGPKEFYGTFRNFMLAAMGRTEEEFQQDCENSLNREYTYLFESVGKDNRIVTPYETNHLVFLSSVENATGEEYLVGNQEVHLALKDWNVRPLEVFAFNTQEDCLKVLGELTGLKEGFVVFNKKTCGRIKIKSPVYLAAHRLRGNGLTLNSVCELIVMNEVDEFLATFPEDASKFDAAIEEFKRMQFRLFVDYEANKHIESQKDFALAIKDLQLSCVMFKARKSGNDVTHEFNQFPVNKRAEWLKTRLI